MRLKMRFVRCGSAVVLLASGVAAFAAGAGKASVCDVREYGAVGDGKTKDTGAIQGAIFACGSRRGGGQVLLERGTFVSGPLRLVSHVTLRVAKDAVLLGSPDREDYGKALFARKETVAPLLGATNAENIVITGGGVIDGNGHVWWDYVKGTKDSGVLGNDHPRPMGVVFDHSRHIRMENITVQNAGFWQIVPYYADDVTFKNMKILAPHSPNTDAIDPFSSSNILMDHVFSSVGDDNVAIKSGAINSPGPDAPSRNITILDCTFESGHGLSIGSEIAGGVQNVRAERIHFKGTDQGIRIKANRDRGADVSHIRFKDIDMVDVKTAILITEYYPNKAPEGAVPAAPITRLTPMFHDIVIENVKATGSPSTGYVIGLPEAPVKDLTLKNVHLSGERGFTFAYADVKTEDFTVKAEKGKDITVGVGATVSGITK